jgi:hypothetical protein
MQRIKTFLFASVTALAAVLAQSATAGAQSLPWLFKSPTPPPQGWTFDGLYVSLSAGGTLTHGRVGQSSNEPFSETEQDFFGGVPTATFLTTGTDIFSSNTSGNGAGAVFTFSGGYNVVLWNNWLVGVQPEASWNLSKTRLTGSSTSTFTSTNVQTFPPGTPSTETSSSTGSNQDTLKNDWTVSLLARGGYVLNNDWLFYGLLGWSWGGFDLDEGDQVFVMNGFTYGGGVEKNFGWLRAFVQVKAINYGNVNLSNSNVGTQNQVDTSGLSVRNFVTTNSGGSRTTISADVVAVTGGITIPLWP